MYRIIKLISAANPFRLLTLFILVVALQGCTAMKRTVHEDDQLMPRPLAEYVERSDYSVAKGEDVIGQLRSIRLEKGDTLPDIARHFSLGLDGVSAANPGVDVWVPAVGERILLPLLFILPDAPRKGIVINLATKRLFEYKGNSDPLTVITFPVGVGAEDRPSPMGQMRVVRKVNRPTWYVPTSIAKAHLKKGDILPATVPPGPDNPLGECALYLSAPSYLIHGTNKPASIGLRATNGCFRLYPEDIKKLYEITPVKTPVNIVSQPYLVGQSKGVVYLEVHGQTEDLDKVELDKVYRKLKTIEREAGRPLDWSKVKNVLAEARGIPVPIFETKPGSSNAIADPIEVKHPDELHYKPKVPELKAESWAVLVAELREKVDAVRLTAIVNHQGPHIPARMVAKNDKYHVVAGPFTDVKEAKDAIKRLKYDLEIEGSLIEPVRKK